MKNYLEHNNLRMTRAQCKVISSIISAIQLIQVKVVPESF